MPRLRPVLVLLALAAAAAAAPAALAAGSPASLLASALAAAGRQHSVHYVVHARLGASTVTQVCDAGASEGIQRITFSRGGQSGHLTVIVTPAGAYVSGDAFSLNDYMGLALIQATADAGAWLFIPRSDPSYATVAAAVTLRSFLDELALVDPLTRAAPRSLGGVLLTGVTGRQAPASGEAYRASLYVPATGLPLPREDLVEGRSARITITLAGWNEPLALEAPGGGRPLGPVAFA